MMENKTDRRSFLKASAAAAAIGTWTALGGRISQAADTLHIISF